MCSLSLSLSHSTLSLTPYHRSLMGQACRKYFVHNLEKLSDRLSLLVFISKIYVTTFNYSSRGKCGPGSSVGIATELRARRSGIKSRWG